MTTKETVTGGQDAGLKEKDLENTGAEVIVHEVNDDDDKKVSDGITPLLDGDEEEEVPVKRGDLKKLHANKENYKTVAIAAKKKSKEAAVVVPKTEEKKPEEKFVTVESQQLKYQKEAIKLVTVTDSNDDAETVALKTEINDNWDAIKAFYTGKGGKDSTEAIREDILDAHAAWKRRNGSSEKKVDGTKTAADLAANRGNGGKGKDTTITTRKRILPVAGSPKTTWFPDKK